MEINGPGSVQGPDPVQPNRISSTRLSSSIKAREADQAEISELAKLKSLLEKVPDIRVDKVARIRAEIEAGTYETSDKIQTVIDRLLEEL